MSYAPRRAPALARGIAASLLIAAFLIVSGLEARSAPRWQDLVGHRKIDGVFHIWVISNPSNPCDPKGMDLHVGKYRVKARILRGRDAAEWLVSRGLAMRRDANAYRLNDAAMQMWRNAKDMGRLGRLHSAGALYWQDCYNKRAVDPRQRRAQDQCHPGLDKPSFVPAGDIACKGRRLPTKNKVTFSERCPRHVWDYEASDGRNKDCLPANRARKNDGTCCTRSCTCKW